MPNVNFTRQELVEAKKKYDVIRDCLSGELVVKNKKTRYLPIPASDNDDGNDKTARYMSYLKRAVFYGVTKRTLDGLCGQIFVREPVIEVPAELEPLVADANGAGVSLVQLAKEAAQYTLGFGRAGLFIDYPAVDVPVTKAQLLDGDIRPSFILFDPSDVLNWRTMLRGARKLLSLVVLREQYVDEDDGFEQVRRTRYRVLRLIKGVYTVEIYITADASSKTYTFTTHVPKDANGNAFTEIPFTFIGAKNNDDTVDDPPLYDIASLNIAHYRNSADYEESVFMVGQPTPVFTGLTEDWVTNVLKGRVFLGSRGSVSLPAGASASLLQVGANSMPFEAMQHKEKQMVALGAKIVEQRGVVRTASEANIDYTTESSVLASSAKNVSAALRFGLEWAARYVGVDKADVKFELNTDFDIASMSPPERQQLLQEWQSGGISWEEYRTNLRKSGIASLPDEEARTMIADEIASLPQLTAQPTGQNNATGQTAP
jgi:Domain of unknown function (DUF4055)